MEYRVVYWQNRKKVGEKIYESAGLPLLKKKISYQLKQQHYKISAIIYDVDTGRKVGIVRH